MAEPVVSIVIPLYNARDVIQETIRSALAQTYREYEIIIIDDGSTDGSGDLVVQFGDRVRYLPQPNGGVAQARNHGIAAANG